MMMIVAFRDSFRSNGLLCLVFDFVPCNLLALMNKHRQGLDPERVRRLIYQLCKAVDCCHSNHIIHRGTRLVPKDLKLVLKRI